MKNKITFRQALKEIFDFVFSTSKKNTDAANNESTSLIDRYAVIKGIRFCPKCQTQMVLERKFMVDKLRVCIYHCEKCGVYHEFQKDLNSGKLVSEYIRYNMWHNQQVCYTEDVFETVGYSASSYTIYIV